MKYALFPGCVLEGAAAEAYTSLNKVCDKLGIEIEEIPNWTCCGASHAQGVNDFAALVIDARNISIAENMGLDIMTVQLGISSISMPNFSQTLFSEV